MKKVFAALWIAVALLLAACGEGALLSGQRTQSPFPAEVPYVGFAPTNVSQMSAEHFQQKPDAFFDSYVSTYADCASTVYYDTLSPAEQKVYRILQYAMDNAQPSIVIDDRLTEPMDCSLEDILYFYSLDSAVVDQNLSMEIATMSVTDGNGNPIISLKKLYLEEFSAAKQAKKEEAITKARQILEQLPQGLTPMERASYFYTYLGQNTQYSAADTQDPKADHLYNALCRGTTNCDGFANAFSLLCNLSGMTCAEKLYTPADGGVGHTWNILCLEDVWYNVDATASVELAEGAPAASRLCFSDSLLEYSYSYAQRLPACTREGIAFDCELSDGDSGTEQLTAALRGAENGYVRVRVSGGELSQEVLQQVANALGCGISTRHYTAADGTCVYMVMKN